MKTVRKSGAQKYANGVYVDTIYFMSLLGILQIQGDGRGGGAEFCTTMEHIQWKKLLRSAGSLTHMYTMTREAEAYGKHSLKENIQNHDTPNNDKWRAFSDVQTQLC